MGDTPDIPPPPISERERTTVVDLNVEPKSSTGFGAWGPQDIAWYSPAGCYSFDYIDVIGAGASGALQVWSLGLSGGGGGGGFGRRAPYATYPGQYFAIRVGYGGAGATLVGQGAMQGGSSGGRTQIDDLIYVEGGWGGNTNGVGGSGGRWEYSWGTSYAHSGGRGGNVSGQQASSGGGGAAGWQGPGYNGIDCTTSLYVACSTNGGQANNGYGAGGGAGNTQGTGANGWPGFEYNGGAWGSGGGGGAGYQTAGNPYGGGGGWYGGGGGACVQTAAAYVARTHPGAGGICVIQYRVYNPIVVSSCSPSGGPLSGGNYVQVNGSGFEGVYAVHFGGVAATGITVHSDGVITCYPPAHAAGAVQVTVYGSAGNGTGNWIYTYYNPASVTAVTPNIGSALGGTAVTVNGTGFSNGISSVQFGGAAATGVSVVNDSTLTCYTPAHAAGVVTVSVYTPYGDGHGANLFTYIDPPSVYSVTPSQGTKDGGTPVTISGANMSGATSVTFGGAAATSVVVVSPYVITCITPPHATGPVNVVVTNGYGPGTGVNVYTYVLLPVITSCTPNKGPQDLPTPVTLAGSNFTGATSVTFGGVAATNVVVVSDTQITCDTPIHSPGTVDIGVTTPNGSGVGISLFSYLTVLQSPLNRAIIMP